MDRPLTTSQNLAQDDYNAAMCPMWLQQCRLASMADDSNCAQCRGVFQARASNLPEQFRSFVRPHSLEASREYEVAILQT